MNETKISLVRNDEWNWGYFEGKRKFFHKNMLFELRVAMMKRTFFSPSRNEHFSNVGILCEALSQCEPRRIAIKSTFFFSYHLRIILAYIFFLKKCLDKNNTAEVIVPSWKIVWSARVCLPISPKKSLTIADWRSSILLSS